VRWETIASTDCLLSQ